MKTMYKIFGAVGCSSCLTCKKLFDLKKIKYSYVDIGTLSDKEREAITDTAREKGVSSLPIVINCVTLEVEKWQEVVASA